MMTSGMHHRLFEGRHLVLYREMINQMFSIIAKMMMLLVIHYLCELQVLTDNFLMWEWIVSNISSLCDNSILALVT